MSYRQEAHLHSYSDQVHLSGAAVFPVVGSAPGPGWLILPILHKGLAGGASARLSYLFRDL